MANLLDQASIVLTPTAYDDGKVLCAKPSEAPYGDFDFSRNSAATRVNAQGLVENVQILSSNLVQNGDFSEEGVQEISNGSFSQEGVQLVTNGDFSNGSTNWNLGASWSIVNEKAVNNGLSNSFLTQNSIVQNGKSYLVSFDIADMTQGSLQLRFGSGAIVTESFTSNGTKTSYYVSSGDAINFYSVSGFDGSIDNVSVREVGQDWTLGSGWSIAEDKAVFDGAGFSPARTNAGLITGKTYKVTFDLDITSGNVVVQLGGATNTFNTSTTHTFYDTATANGAYSSFVSLYSSLTSNFSITNISVKEVLQDWSVEDYGAVSASAVITPNTEGVKLEKTVSADWRSSFLVQPISYTDGSQYKITFRLKNGNLPSGGGVYVRASYSSSVENIASNLVLTNDWVEYTYYFLADSGSLDISFGNVNWQNAGVGEYFYIDDVSVIEITDDTNLPRINYEGFSYQDALGSELVLNGSFEDGSDWGLGTNWSISGGNLLSTNSAQYVSANQNISGITLGETYQININVNSTSGGYIVKVGSSGSIYALSLGLNTITAVWNGINNGLAIYNNASSTGNISIDNVSVKEYLGQSIIPESGCGSWLFEPQSTNLIEYSEDFSDASWLKVNTTITNDYGISPDGTNNSARLVFGSGTAYVNRSQTIGVGDQASSIYVKGISGQILKFGKGGNVGSGTNFTLNGEWQRLEQISTNSGTAYHITSNLGGANATEVEVWGAMLENQSYATSYIPTSGTTVTRNQETCINATPEINSEEGVLYAEIAALSNDLTNRIISITNGASVNGVSLYYSSSSNVIRANYYVGGVAQCNLEYILADETDFSKIAFVWKINRFELWVDSIKRAEDLSGAVNVANTMNDLSFRRLGSNIFFGNTKDLQVYTKALSDAELIKLTT